MTIDGPEGSVNATPEPSDEACLERGSKPGCGDIDASGHRGSTGEDIPCASKARPKPGLRPSIRPKSWRSRSPRPVDSRNEAGAATQQVAVTRELSLLLIALFGAELGVRAFRRWAERRRSRDPEPST